MPFADDVQVASSLFDPLAIRGLTLANRIVMSPMTRNQSPLGVPNDKVAAYYSRRAQGGVGLIITEGVGIDHPASVGYTNYNGVDIPFLVGEEHLAAWTQVVDAVHAQGGKIAPQLWHQGPMRLDGSEPFPAHRSSRPSGIWGPGGGRSTIPQPSVDLLIKETWALSDSEIADIVAGYARSAALAKRAGFDAIAVHGAHGYLIDSFFWPETNKRTDRYGGDIAGRTRFAVEVLTAIRNAIGPDMPIIFRFSQWKQQDFEATIAQNPAELEALLVPLAEAGVDVFDASTRDFRQAAFEGSSLNLAGWAKKLTGKLAMTVGGIGLDKDIYNSYAQGVSVSASLVPVIERFDRGEFDLVGIGRGLIADPDWVRKTRTGEPRNAFDVSMLGVYP